MTRAVPILAALAVLVAIARLARRLERDALVDLTSTAQAPDDSEVVGMPTTLGPGWYVELAPTSRN